MRVRAVRGERPIAPSGARKGADVALVKFADCGREVSDTAPTCPGCGRPMASAAVEPGAKETAGAEPKKRLLSKPVRALVAVFLCIIVFVIAFRAFSPGGGGGGAVRRALRGQQVIADEQIVVPAGGAQMHGFEFPSARPLLVEVTGVADASKGFSVYLMNAGEWEKFRAGKEFRHLPAFQGLKVTSFRKVATVPAGKYGVVIQNSENILTSMTVRVRIVADPE